MYICDLFRGWDGLSILGKPQQSPPTTKILEVNQSKEGLGISSEHSKKVLIADIQQ